MSKDKTNLSPKQMEARQRRQVLSSLSRKARILREARPELEDKTVNEILMCTLYNKRGNLVFKKFNEWKAEGYTIKKGEKGYMLWAQPLKAQEQNEQPTELDEPDKDGEFFPVCYLFSNEQVIKREPKKQQERQQAKPVPNLDF